MRVEVKIGRNIGAGSPLIQEWWDAFDTEVRDIFAVNGYPLTVIEGSDQWAGVWEDSRHYIGSLSTIDWYRWAALARRFHQDAIALHIEGSIHWLLIGGWGQIQLGDKYEPSTTG